MMRALEEVMRRLNSVWAVSSTSLLIALVSIAVWLYHFSQRQRRSRDLPPGPTEWPLVGSLLSVGFQYRHRTFARLASKYGPLMHLSLGTADVIVVSSPEIAMEVLKTKDAEWSSRPPSSAGKYIGFDFHSMDFAPNGAHWRHLRKICATHVFSPARIKAQTQIRRQEFLAMVDNILSASQRGEIINFRSVCDSVSLNIISRLLFGNKYTHSDHPIAKEMHSFMEDVKEAVVLIGALIVSDLVPLLDWLDLQGYDRRVKRVSKKLERVYRLIIDDHRRDLENESYASMTEENKDFVHILLSLEGQEQLSEKSLMGLMTDVLLFGIDITATGIEWAMAELIQNQRVLKKLQGEIDRVVGDGRLVDESDMWQIPYLDSVAKEALRLHPPVPLTDPHFNEEAVDVAGYRIPSKSVMFVNIWGLAHDPKLWDEPFEFRPQRFEDASATNININGNDFRFLPFSSGRRRCPAANMAYVKMQHAIALLVHAFDWSLPEGQVDVNMEEGFGVTCPMKIPLLALATPRPGHGLHNGGNVQ